jgi:hypothetical protein
MARGQLKSLATVGQILDFLGFSIKMLFVEKKSMTNNDLLLLNEIFQLMPSSWESDPVKVNLFNIMHPSFACLFNYKSTLFNRFTGSFDNENNL